MSDKCTECGQELPTTDEAAVTTVMIENALIPSFTRFDDPDERTGWYALKPITVGSKSFLRGVGNVEIVHVEESEPDSYGEYGYQTEARFVLKVGDRHFLVEGTCDSYGGPDYRYADVKEVNAKEKKVVVWE